MSAAKRLLQLIELEGGTVTLWEDSQLHCVDVSPELLEALKVLKPAIVRLLQKREQPKSNGFLFPPEELARMAEEYREQQNMERRQRWAADLPEPHQTKMEKKLEHLSPHLVQGRVLRATQSKPQTKRLAKEATRIQEQLAKTEAPQTPEPAKKFVYQARTPEQWQARIDEANSFGWKKRARKSKRRTAPATTETEQPKEEM